jgi:hypothetical protein
MPLKGATVYTLTLTYALDRAVLRKFGRTDRLAWTEDNPEESKPVAAPSETLTWLLDSFPGQLVVTEGKRLWLGFRNEPVLGAPKPAIPLEMFMEHLDASQAPA